MASLFYFHNRLCGHLRTYIVVFKRRLGKRTEDVKLRHCRRRALNAGELRTGALSDIVKNLVFEFDDSVLRAENLCLKILELLSYESLAVCKGLFSYIFVGYKLFI